MYLETPITNTYNPAQSFTCVSQSAAGPFQVPRIPGVQGGFDPSNFNLWLARKVPQPTPGARIDFIPTEAALPRLVTLRVPYFSTSSS